MGRGIWILLLALSLLLAFLYLLILPSEAQGPVWHGEARHAARGVNGQTLLGQTTRLICEGGRCWQGVNGNYVHFASEQGHAVGSMAVYDSQGQPVTQYPNSVRGFRNNVESGRYTQSQMPAGAQARAAAQSLSYALPHNVSVVAVPYFLTQQAQCSHGYLLICTEQGCMCGDPNAPQTKG